MRNAFNDFQKPFIKLNLLRIEIFAKQNPDLRHLNECLPNLKCLYVVNKNKHIGYFEHIHFNNVEYFGIGGLCSALPFSFTKLKIFHYSNEFDPHDGLTLNKHFYETLTSAEYLTELTLRSINSIEDNTFNEMLQSTNFIENIKEITVRMTGDILPESVIRFLKQSKSLKTFTLYRCYIDSEIHSNNIAAITSRLDDKWKCEVIQINGRRSFSIERITE